MLNRLNGNKITWCISLWNTVLGDLIKILLFQRGFPSIFPLSLYFTLPSTCFASPGIYARWYIILLGENFCLWNLRTQGKQKQI